ncbi:phosphoribosylformimino-5-aminoimidazole carboxamide ribotide isomerase [Elusimicrobium posterum]|uniref:1-(5-phosphoribosyl)-5-[(5- phosphoribosylamino)methylideneamino]imidazole-4- carboxamide isomerase n=1 Tax=Elusimicrobium posterum TaxID=3116653 RepID=UPI003C73127B
MIILPAIDLIDGECVRLLKGDFNKKTVYGTDPFEVVQGFEGAGAKYLHIVDLSGAKNPKKRQNELIKDIAQNTDLSVQTGGGIREEEQIADYLDHGVDRVIVGSLAATKPLAVSEWINKFGVERIVLSLDVNIKNGEPVVALHGWKEATDIKLFELLSFYGSFKGVQILCTDISKDGTLAGPNLQLYKEIKEDSPMCFLQASGGVSEIRDLVELKACGCDGAIIGKALYEDKINLEEALNLNL